MKHNMKDKLHAYRLLPAQLNSARSVLRDRPKAILVWLEIWAQDNAPQYQKAEIDYDEQHRCDDKVFIDVPRSEVFV